MVAFTAVALIAVGLAVSPQPQSATAATLPDKVCGPDYVCRMTFESSTKITAYDIGSTSEITFTLIGAAGGNSGGAQGGRGARVVYKADPAKAGSYIFEIGGRGADSAGSSGGAGGAGGGGEGGDGRDGGAGGGGGGGATVLKASPNIRGQNSQTVAVAAGGGGAGTWKGGDGGSDGEGADGCGGRVSGAGGCPGSGDGGGNAYGAVGGNGASPRACIRYECFFDMGGKKAGGGGGGGGLSGGGGGGMTREGLAGYYSVLGGGGGGGTSWGAATGASSDGARVVVEWVPGPTTIAITTDRDVAPAWASGWYTTVTVAFTFTNGSEPTESDIREALALESSAGNIRRVGPGSYRHLGFSFVVSYPVIHERSERSPGDALITARWAPTGLRSSPATIHLGDEATSLSVETPQGAVAAKTPFSVTARVTHPSVTPGGVVRFTVGTRDEVEVPLTNGAATLTIPGLTPGTYPVSVVYPGARGVPGATASPTPSVSVQKATSTVALAASNLSWGTAGALTAKVPAGAGGTVAFSVKKGDVTRALGNAVPDADGNAVLTAPTDLEPGASIFTASYSGDDAYTPATADLQAAVGLRPVTIRVSGAEMRTDTTGRLEAELTESATGVVDFTAVPVNGGRSINLGAAAVSGGRAALDVPPRKLGVGGYRVTASYTGDPHHMIATAEGPLMMRAPAVLKSLTLTPAVGSAVAGRAIAFTVAGLDTEGRPMTVSSPTLTADGGTCEELSCTLTAAGYQIVRVTSGDVGATTTVRVLPGAPARIDVSPTSASVEVSNRDESGGVTFTPRVFDQWGNLTDASVTATSPSGWCDGTRCGSTVAGESTVTFAAGDASATASLTAVPGTATGLTLTPSALSVAAGTEFTVEAQAVDRFGNVLSPIRTSFYAPGVTCTRQPAVAVVRCTGTTAGVTTVSASHDGASASRQISIVPAAASRSALAPESASMTAGESVTFSMTTADEWDNPISDAVTAVVKSGAATCDGLICSSTVAGESVISFSSAGMTRDATLTVTPGPASQIGIRTPEGPLTAGSPTTFQSRVSDQFGNVIDGAAIVLTADPDGTCVGRTCTITRAGDHTITSTFVGGGLSVSTRVQVVAGAASRSSVSPSAATVVAGRSATFTMTTTDLFGNPVTADVTATVERGAAVCDGTTCSSTVAGDSTIVLESAGQTQRVELTVEPAAAARATITQATPSDTVTAGQPVEFQVSVLDRFGNALRGAGVTLTASPDGTCAGLTCTMTRAGAHRVTVQSADGPSQSVPVTVVAGAVDRSTVTPSTATVVAGESVALSMTTTDTWGNPVVEPVAVEVESGAATCDGASCSSRAAGESVIKLSSAGQVQRVTLTVTPASAARVTLERATPSETAVAGRPVGYTTSVLDRFGNAITGANVTLSAEADGTCDGMTCTFTRIGEHAVTARVGSDPQTALRSSEVRVDVVPAEAASVTFELPETTTAGQELTPGLAAADRFGNPVDGATLTLVPVSETHAADRLSEADTQGAEIRHRRAVDAAPAASADSGGAGGIDCTAGCRPTVAGTYAAVAVAGEASARKSVTVAAGAATTLSLTPADSRVQQGATTTFEVAAEDAFGNDAGATAENTTLASDHVDDVIRRLTVTFPSAGARVITARLGDATATASVDVAAPEPSGAGATGGGSGSNSSALAGTGIEASAIGAGGLLLLAVGAVLLGRRRRRTSTR